MASVPRWACLGVLLGMLVTSYAPSSSADSVEDGKKSFQTGVNLLTDPDGAKYDEALPHFKRAYELTKNWKVLSNLGLCYFKLERVGEAIETYERYLKEGDKNIDKEERAQIERDLTTLKGQLVKVKIEVPAAGVQLTDERIKPNGSKVMNVYQLSATTTELGIYAGRHVMTVILDQQPIKWEVDLPPGGSQSHKFEKTAAAPSAPPSATAPPPPTTAPPPPTQPPSASTSVDLLKPPAGLSMPVYIAGGATLALALGTTITGVLYLGKRSDYVAINGKPDRTKDEAQSARDSAATMSTVSTILGVTTLLGAGVTTYLYLSGDGSTSPKTGKPGKPRFSPWVSPYGGGFVLGGAL